jgi:DNA-directed RNA polymerase subunit RPC12/RpoP
MTQSLSIRCSGCQARIKAAIRLIGQARACPACGHRIVVQPVAPEEAGPILVIEETPHYWPQKRAR